MRHTTALLVLLVALAPAVPVRAQDWSVRRSGFDPRVVSRYKAMLLRRPHDPRLLKKLVSLYRRNSSMTALINHFRGLVRKNPRSHAVQIILAHLFSQTGAAEAALQHYARAAALKPADSLVHAAAGALHEKMGSTSKAMDAYGRALKRASTKGQRKRTLRALARVALTARDHAAASKYLRQLTELNPGDLRLKIKLARALNRAQQRAAALSQLRQVLAREGDTARKAEVLKQMGEILHAMDRHKEAVVTYRKAMALAPRGHWLRREITEKIIAVFRQQEDLRTLIKDLEKRYKRRGAFEHQVLGRLYDEVGDQDRAKRAYQAALNKEPHSIKIRLRLIALLDSSGQADEVLKQYEKLARIAAGEPRHQIEYARRLHQAGQQNKALEVLDRCGKRFPGDASVHSLLVDLYSRWGDLKRATRSSQALVKIEPRDPSHIIALGEQYFLSGKKLKAMEVWKRLLRVVPQRHAALAKLAEVYGNHDLFSKARQLYAKAIKLRPRELAYHRSLARLLESNRKRGEALKAWERLLALARAAKDHGATHEARSRVIDLLRRSYRLSSRIRLLRRTSSSLGSDLETGTFLAQAYTALGRLELAAMTYQEILKHHPDHLVTLAALERTYRRQRKLPQAVALLKRLAALKPQSAREYYQRIADLLLQLYNDKEALVYAHKALALGSGDARSHHRMGELYEKKEDYEGALKAYARAIQINPNHFASHFAAARLHSLQGQPKQAEALYRQVLLKASAPEKIRKAFRLGMNIAAYRGTLGTLEKDLLPLTITSTQADLYRELLVKIYRRRIPGLIHRLNWAGDDGRRLAQKELHLIGKRGLATLLEELSRSPETDTDLIYILGYLGNPNAVPPLLRVAEMKEQEVVVFYGSLRAAWNFRHRFRHRRPFTYRSSPLTWFRRQTEAILALGRIAHPRSIPGLVRLLGSGEGPVRDAAAWALSRTSALHKDTAPLYKALGDVRSTVQMMACAGLGLSGDPLQRPVLEEVMQDPGRPERVRAACAWGLGALGDVKALDSLVQVVQAGDGPIQRCAAWALGALADRRAISPLLRTLWNRKRQVRENALWALERIASGRGPRPTTRTPDVIFKSMRLDEDAFLERLSTTPAIERGNLHRLVLGYSQAIVRGIQRALGRHQDVILRVLSDLDASPGRLSLGPLTAGAVSPADRAPLDKQLKAIGAELTPTLRSLLSHRAPLVRARVISVLAKMPDTDLPALLRRGLDDPAQQVRMETLTVLGARRDRLPPGALLSLARHAAAPGGRWQEREAAIKLLGIAHREGARDALLKAAKDKNGFVRAAAKRALRLQP